MTVNIDAVSSTINFLYSTVDDRCSWQDALGSVAQLLRAERFTVHYAGEDGAMALDSWPMDPEGLIEYARDYADKDLRAIRIMQGRRGLLSTRDLMTEEEIARCPVHQEYYRKWPECWNTLLCPMGEDEALVIPAAQRGSIRQDFHDEERAILQLISQHVGRVTRLKQLLPTGGIQTDDLAAGLDAFDEAIILLDARGIVRFMNRRAAHMAMRKDGFYIHRGVLIAANHACRDPLDKLLANSLRLAMRKSLQAPESIALRRQNDRRPLLISAFVVPDSTAGRISVLVRVRETSPPKLPKIEVVQATLGLTATEARLALATAEGRALLDYAEQEEVTIHTARTHMRNIREKLKVRRQADVVRIVMAIGTGS